MMMTFQWIPFTLPLSLRIRFFPSALSIGGSLNDDDVPVFQITINTRRIAVALAIHPSQFNLI
jgi:hypothetical protein